MAWVNYAVTNAPEVFIFLAVALGSWLGRIRIHGFAIGATACTLIVAVILGQLGLFAIPAMLRSIFFGLFVFTIGYRSGPEFFASLSLATLGQVVLALVMGAVGLIAVLVFAHVLHLDSGTAAGLAAGSLTQSSMMGTALGALSQLGLDDAVMKQQQANVAAGYAVTYILGYIIVLLFVPLVAPRLMGVNLKDEASKLERELSGGTPRKQDSLLYRKFQARAYLVSAAAGSKVKDVEAEIGMRTVIERILRAGNDVEVNPDTALQVGDEILVAGPSAAVVAIAPKIGTEIEGEHVMRSVPGDVVEVYVTARELHGQSLEFIVKMLGDQTRGLFLRSLVRRGQDVPVSPLTRIYVGDVMTLVGLKQDLSRVIPRIGQPFRSNEQTDVAFLAGGLVGRADFWIVQSENRRGRADPRRRGRRVDCRPRLRLAPLPQARDGRVSAGRAAVLCRNRTWGICRVHRLGQRASRPDRDSDSWADVAGGGYDRDAHAAHHRHVVRAASSAHESCDYLWRARRSHDRRRRCDRLL